MKGSLLIAAAIVLQAGCSSPSDSGALDPRPDCTAEARAGIALTTVDSVSGQPIATAGIVSAQDGTYLEKAVGLPPRYFMAYERKGTYAVTVQIDGFQPWRMTNVVVPSDRCHVNTVTVTARLVR